MGFTIDQPILITRLGLSLSAVFVTFRASYSVYRSPSLPAVVTATMQTQPEQPLYHITGRMVWYTSSDYQSLQPLHEENISITQSEYPTTSNPLTLLYNQAKSVINTGRSPPLTFTDDNVE